MCLLRVEFFRLLPAAIAAFEVDGDTVRWTEADRRGTIHLVPLPDRRLGSVVIPRHRVEIAFEVSEAEGETFLARFHRAFLRGGG